MGYFTNFNLIFKILNSSRSKTEMDNFTEKKKNSKHFLRFKKLLTQMSPKSVFKTSFIQYHLTNIENIVCGWTI